MVATDAIFIADIGRGLAVWLAIVGVVMVAALAAVALALAYPLLRRKNIDLIVRAAAARKREEPDGTVHVFFCIADHYEPLWHGADAATGLERVKLWHDRYPKMVDGFRDNGGNAPRHIFFYPEEEYLPECLDLLADLTRRGYGDVEVHLHHDNDTSDGLRAKLEGFKHRLRNDHGLLHSHPETNEPVYAFIHGNWSLDDSGVGGRLCGVRDELIVLRETGCYADFTYPSAPHPTQPPMINRIYYATDDPHLPCSHHDGVDVEVGGTPSGDLLMVTGPLALNWKRRRRGILPAVENGDITPLNPVTPDRVDLWVRTGVHVRGLPNWVFIKAYTHGTQEGNSKYLLGDGAFVYKYLLERYNDGNRYVLHFSTPWEMVRAIKVAEAGDGAAMRAIETFTYSF